MSILKALKKLLIGNSEYLDAYHYILTKRIENYKSSISDLNNSASEMVLSYDRVATTTSMRKYFRLVEFPHDVPDELFGVLRDCENILDVHSDSLEKEAPIYINYTVKMEHHFIDFDSKDMQARRNLWEKYIKEEEEDLSSDDNRFATKAKTDTLDRNAWLLESWNCFQKAVSENLATPVMELIVEICVCDNSNQSVRRLNKACETFLRLCTSYHIKFKPIKTSLWDSIWEFFKTFAPISSEDLTTIPAEVTKFPVTTDFISHMTDFTQGTLSDTEIVMGFDIKNLKLVYKDAASTGEAENILITGGTGSGKSCFCKGLVFQFLFNDYTVVVLDRDGEYVPIANEVDGKVISFKSGSYFDTFEIADLTGDEDVDNGLYEESVVATMQFFNTLCSSIAEPEMTSDEIAMFSLVHANLRKKFNIDILNKSTWKNSKREGYSYLGFYKTLLEMRDTDKQFYERYNSKLERFIDKLRVYFDVDGIYHSRFLNPISVNEIYEAIDENAGMVVFDLNIPEEVTPSKDTVIKLITASHLTSLILAHNKKMHKFTLTIVEELNRYLQNPHALIIASSMATGNRKKNAVSIFLTNTPYTLISGNENLKNIKDNMNYLLFGKFVDGDEEHLGDIATAFGLSNAVDSLNLVATHEEYKHVFMAHDGRNGETALIKSVLPRGYEYLFGTRDSKERSA